jgi:hypothetical protein
LETAGLPEELSRSAERFCHACDAERFTPRAASTAGRLADDATQLLHALEKSLSDDTPTKRLGSTQTNLQPFVSPFLPFSLSPLLLAFLSPASATSAEMATLADADRWFQQGIAAEQDSIAARQAFAQAARRYQQLVDGGQRQAELLRQLGDAYLLADDLPRALFAYRLGLREAPHVQAFWDHLELARDRVPYPNGDERHRPPPSDWPTWLPRPSPGLLLASAATLHALAWTALALWWLRRQTSTLVWAGLFLAVALGVLGWWGYGAWQRDQEAQRPFAVVAFNNMTLRRGNGTLFAPHTDLPIVHRGMEARLLNERGGWVQLAFPAGEVGWLPRRAVLID